MISMGLFGSPVDGEGSILSSGRPLARIPQSEPVASHMTHFDTAPTANGQTLPTESDVEVNLESHHADANLVATSGRRKNPRPGKKQRDRIKAAKAAARLSQFPTTAPAASAQGAAPSRTSSAAGDSPLQLALPKDTDNSQGAQPHNSDLNLQECGYEELHDPAATTSGRKVYAVLIAVIACGVLSCLLARRSEDQVCESVVDVAYHDWQTDITYLVTGKASFTSELCPVQPKAGIPYSVAQVRPSGILQLRLVQIRFSLDAYSCPQKLQYRTSIASHTWYDFPKHLTTPRAYVVGTSGSWKACVLDTRSCDYVSLTIARLYNTKNESAYLLGRGIPWGEGSSHPIGAQRYTCAKPAAEFAVNWQSMQVFYHDAGQWCCTTHFGIHRG